MRILVLSHATYADPPTRKVFDHIAGPDVEVLLAMPKRIKHPFGPAAVPPTPWETPVRLALLDTWHLHENGTHVILRGLPRLIREYRPDVIHCVMEPWSITCLLVLFSLKALPGRRPRFGVQAAETLTHQGALPVRVVRHALYRRVVARADYFIGWSTRAVEAARELGLNGTPAITAPALAVNTDTFRPLSPELRREYRARFSWDEDCLVVGFVGRFEAQKGIMDLVQAMDLAIREEPRLRLSFLGSGSLAGRIEAAATSRTWITMSSPEDAAGVARHMAAVDLLVVPSRSIPSWDEQFGLVAIEAMACGTPVIVSESGSLPETVGDAALLVPEGDVAELSRSILALANSAANREELSHRGHARVQKLFAPTSLAEQFTRVMVST
jgi:glycosyltransferase involved in cell wall biosynthesis